LCPVCLPDIIPARAGLKRTKRGSVARAGEEQAARYTEEALKRVGLADCRPLCRKLLLRLKDRDPEAFREATRRYQDEMEPSIADGTADPVATWLDYGAWLAGQLAEGSPLAIDASGRARPFDSSADCDKLVLHVPADDRTPAILLAMPAAPSDPQRETAELLLP